MFNALERSVRPTLEKEFWVWDADMDDYVAEEYIATGKLLSKEVTYEDGQLEKRVVFSFVDKQACDEYFSDPVIKFQEKVKLKFNLYHEIAYSLNTTGTVITRDLYKLYKR